MVSVGQTWGISHLRVSGSCSWLGRSTRCSCSCRGCTCCCSTTSGRSRRSNAMQHALLPSCCIVSRSAGSLPWGVKAQRGTRRTALLPAADAAVAETRGTADHRLQVAGRPLLQVAIYPTALRRYESRRMHAVHAQQAWQLHITRSVQTLLDGDCSDSLAAASVTHGLTLPPRCEGPAPLTGSLCGVGGCCGVAAADGVPSTAAGGAEAGGDAASAIASAACCAGCCTGLAEDRTPADGAAPAAPAIGGDVGAGSTSMSSSGCRCDRVIACCSKVHTV